LANFIVTLIPLALKYGIGSPDSSEFFFYAYIVNMGAG